MANDAPPAASRRRPLTWAVASVLGCAMVLGIGLCASRRWIEIGDKACRNDLNVGYEGDMQVGYRGTMVLTTQEIADQARNIWKCESEGQDWSGGVRVEYTPCVMRLDDSGGVVRWSVSLRPTRWDEYQAFCRATHRFQTKMCAWLEVRCSATRSGESGDGGDTKGKTTTGVE